MWGRRLTPHGVSFNRTHIWFPCSFGFSRYGRTRLPAAPEVPSEIDDGYEAFARQTQRTLGAMKAAVSKADRA